MLIFIFSLFIRFSDGCELILSIQKATDKLSVRHESITLEKFLEVTQDQRKHKHYIRKNSVLHNALKRLIEYKIQFLIPGFYSQNHNLEIIF